jgi:hypothetical protein
MEPVFQQFRLALGMKNTCTGSFNVPISLNGKDVEKEKIYVETKLPI